MGIVLTIGNTDIELVNVKKEKENEKVDDTNDLVFCIITDKKLKKSLLCK